MTFSLFGIIGTVDTPDPLTNFQPVESGGIAQFINIFVDALIVGAGVYALFNFVLAGYAFLSAGNEPKKIEGAWAKIWQTIMGLVVASGAFVIAAIISQIFYGDWNTIFNPVIPTP